jgi:hypothetical protein
LWALAIAVDRDQIVVDEGGFGLLRDPDAASEPRWTLRTTSCSAGELEKPAARW